MQDRDAEKIIYQEWQLPNSASFLANILVLPSIWLAIAPISNEFSLPIAVAATLGSVLWRIAMSKRIVLTTKELVIGKAHIPRTAIGRAVGIDQKDQFHEKGAGLDARAFLALRSLRGLVKITLIDPNDPTPYLLVSTRHATQLVDALNG